MKRFFLLMVIVTLGMSFSGCRAFHRWNAGFQNDIKQEYIIQDAKSRISNYEWFYSMYGEIQATKNKVKILEGEPEQKGVKLVLQSMIAEYNAKSKMSMTRELWKASDLPYQIEGEF